MRRSFRLLAAVKPSRYLEPHAPTGLTGLLTHPSPRSTLLYLYSQTLEKLKAIPESSLYRQSTEAVTKHRMQIVQSAVPEGWKEWNEKAKQTILEHPEVFNTPDGEIPHDGEKLKRVTVNGKDFVITKPERGLDVDEDEWDGEEDQVELEGVRSTDERKHFADKDANKPRPGSESKTVVLEHEPILTGEQIEGIEGQIGAGLIEEIIQVAEGELGLVDVIIKSKA
jgi:NADH dehydrogenase (ubiquinone) 1 alpha subcomplex subunit 5